MSTFTKTEAEQIANKLDAEISKGRKHDLAQIRWQGQVVASYGIRRGKKDLGHDYIPKQIFISIRETLDLARRPLSRDAYFEILRSKGVLPGVRSGE